MPKKINKVDEGTMYTTKVLFLIVLVALVILLLMFRSKQPPATQPAMPSTTSETINGTSDLTKAQDQLEMVNVDSVDNGLMQLQAEVASY